MMLVKIRELGYSSARLLTAARISRPGELVMKGKKIAVWIAVGIGVGVAIGAATHSMALWICIGVVVGVAIGAVSGRR